MVTLKQIKNDEMVKALVKATDRSLDVMNYTEHGERHAGYVSRITGMILSKLGYDERTVELGYIAGYLHDIGNCINRKFHGITGANLAFDILNRMKMPPDEVAIIIGAIGNHEEEIGVPINPVSAALIIADKSDAHKTRVHKGNFNPNDIHDRVNYSIKKNVVEVDAEKKLILSKIYMDNMSSVMEYFEIYLSRIVISEKAARFLGTSFRLYINDVLINNIKEIGKHE
ncbi:MAG: HD domain-containing protein [Clostridia bacterium]|nr:HD domain-containing protein [Clostridia bacterium]MDY5264879.1 HD domain-containing protein [Eubacteriales bacterium]MDY5440543.1 HD domain-containing protein [Eubacteriales bacterium]